MKKLVVILFMCMCLSCVFDAYHLNEPQPLRIISEDIFSINGKVFNEINLYIPFTIYNPNKYDITISIDEIAYLILSYDSLLIE